MVPEKAGQHFQKTLPEKIDTKFQKKFRKTPEIFSSDPTGIFPVHNPFHRVHPRPGKDPSTPFAVVPTCPGNLSPQSPARQGSLGPALRPDQFSVGDLPYLENPDAQQQPGFAKMQPGFPQFSVFHAGDDQAGMAEFGGRFSGRIDQPYWKRKRRPVLDPGFRSPESAWTSIACHYPCLTVLPRSEPSGTLTKPREIISPQNAPFGRISPI